MIRIFPASGEPIYQQVIQQIKGLVLKGALQPGDKLPSVRELAVMATVNPNTVSKAYRELEREQVVITIKGRGTYIHENPVGHTSQRAKDEAIDKLKATVMDLQFHGLSANECCDLIHQFYHENRKENGHA